ncbi:YwmB family TATA-box binding protein [Metabacillus niabensis]|uniref:YwmB family TATA-box binding protein n=1 Tax=Metabacillus TaxID=2675233 RepID=UPI00119EACD2
MKKREIAVIIFTMMLVFTMVTNRGVAENESKLSILAEAMQEQSVQIDDWTLYAKKNVEKKTIEEMKLFTEQYRHYNWTYEQDEEKIKAIGVFDNKKEKKLEKLQLITTLKNEMEQTYILYEVKGVGVQSNWDEIEQDFKENAFDIFHENPTIFACINGTFDDMIEVSLNNNANKFLKQFKAHSVEKLQEENFLSVSAKTALWEDFIPTTNDEMNLQLALRTDGLGDSTTVVIGTPIITSEY